VGAFLVGFQTSVAMAGQFGFFLLPSWTGHWGEALIWISGAILSANAFIGLQDFCHDLKTGNP
jgi:hypothetical protein